MSILKALERANKEKVVSRPIDDNVVPFDKNERRTNVPPEILYRFEKTENTGIVVGVPGTNSAFNEQANLSVGLALANDAKIATAGATLNAVSSTRSLPKCASWTIDAERVEPHLIAITQPNSTYCEEYRSLRTHILHKSQEYKNRGKELKSLVVASTGPSEGKSITAINLAWLLAQTDGIKCLIIDSDLRMPSLTDYLGIETESGLSEILTQKRPLTESLVKLEPAGLYLLPGGEARQDVAELISGSKFTDILEEARTYFDYVIIDAPPLGIFTDANLLINHADGAFIVVRANKTRYSAVNKVLEELPRERMLGVVLNQSDDVMSESQYYHYNYYQENRKKGYKF